VRNRDSRATNAPIDFNKLSRDTLHRVVVHTSCAWCLACCLFQLLSCRLTTKPPPPPPPPITAPYHETSLNCQLQNLPSFVDLNVNEAWFVTSIHVYTAVFLSNNALCTGASNDNVQASFALSSINKGSTMPTNCFTRCRILPICWREKNSDRERLEYDICHIFKNPKILIEPDWLLVLILTLLFIIFLP